MRRVHVVYQHRKGQVLSTRRYASFTNALRKTSERVVLDSKPGDIFEFVEMPSGLQTGTVKATAKSFTCHWYWS